MLTRWASSTATSSRPTYCWTNAANSGSPISDWRRSPLEPGLTQTGELLGTLRYASPEQALSRRGVVDHRTDVYSLGATLYELLTLRPIFEGRDRKELLRQIADDDPRPPRSFVPSVPAELETVVLKALRKEPSERYQSAQELADDLQRFLDNRPILARRPTLMEHVRQWARRRPSVVAAGVVILFLLAVGSLVSAALVRGEQEKTRAEQRKAEEAYRSERQRAEEAEARLRLARRSVDELIQVSEQELADRPGMEDVRKRLLRSALAYYQEIIEQRRDDPNAQAELLDTTRRVEKILADLAVLQAASKLYLLGATAVHDDLGLNDEQRTKVKELTARLGKQWIDSFNDFGRLSPADHGRRVLEQARADEAEVNAILTTAQQARLRQIALQSDGPGAFRDPEVVAQLHLTPEQRDGIRAIEEEAFFTWLRTMGPGGPPPGGPDAEPKERTPNERILALLTEEQARRWEEMSGAPVQGGAGAVSHAVRPTAQDHGAAAAMTVRGMRSQAEVDSRSDAIRCGSIGAKLAAIGTKATPENTSACRIDAVSASISGLGLVDRPAANCPNSTFRKSSDSLLRCVRSGVPELGPGHYP